MFIFKDLFSIDKSKYKKRAYSKTEIEMLIDNIVDKQLCKLVVNIQYYEYLCIFLEVTAYKSLFGYVFCNIDKHTSLNTFIGPNLSGTYLD